MPFKVNQLILVSALLFSALSVSAAPCGTGITDSTTGGASSTSPATGTCDYLVAGYYVTGGTLPPVACPFNSYCPGGNAANGGANAGTFVVGGTGSAAAWVSNGGATGCPSVNILGDATSNAGGKTATDVTDCVLNPGYYQDDDTPAVTVDFCLDDNYCPGGDNLDDSFAAGVTSVGNEECPYLSTGSPGDGTTNSASSANVAVSDCIITAGFSLDSTGDVQDCPEDEYCPGGLPASAKPTVTTATKVGTDGGVPCPAGTASAVSSTVLTDCEISAGYYVTSLQGDSADTPGNTITGDTTLCPTGSVCPGSLAWAEVLLTGMTEISPNYMLTDLSDLQDGSGGVTQCQTNGVSPGYACLGDTPDSTEFEASDLYDGAETTSDNYYVSALGVVAICPTDATCTGAQSLDTPGGISAIISGYYLSAIDDDGLPTITACPTGATCTGDSAYDATTSVIADNAATKTGYYVSAVTNGGVATVSPCLTGATCDAVGGQSLDTPGGITEINSGYYLSAIDANDLPTITACPTGATCTGDSAYSGSSLIADNAATKTGFYVSAVTNGVATVSACLTGATCAVTNGQPLGPVGGQQLVGITKIKSGYYTSAVDSNGLPTVTACPTGAKCAGDSSYSAVTFVGFTVKSGFYTSAVASNGTPTITACPTGAICSGDSSYSGSVSDSHEGADTLPGYWVSAMASGVATVAPCPTGGICDGGWNIHETGGVDAVNNGYFWSGYNPDTVLPCPVGADCSGTGNANGHGEAITLSGYFIAPGSEVPVQCPSGSMCPGEDQLGADGWDYNTNGGQTYYHIPLPCPFGSAQNLVTDSNSGTEVTCTYELNCFACVVLPGFYTPTANTLDVCDPGSYCPGGGFLGIAGGEFQCGPNSTLAACNDFLDNVQTSSYAAGATTVAAAASPAVTVSPAPITVTPAPITVTTAPVTVTPAPITVNVPAPVVSAASTRSSALVLVLAALAALVAF